MSTKLSKSSSVSDHSNNKATPKAVNRLSRTTSKPDADPASPLKNTRVSVDRSPRSNLISKPSPVERRSPKLTTSPDKQQSRVQKGSELQAQLSLVQEDLKNAKEKLVLIEKEKTEAAEGLKAAQQSAEEANEKLREAQVAQKRAEENSEIEKFRAVEMEQAAIESTQKKEEEWQKELEAVRNQHAQDVAALVTATEELQKVKQELATNLDAKNQAITRVEDVTKITETHAQKIVSLSAEVAQLKALLDSKLENQGQDTTKLLSELNLEIDVLRQELEKAKDDEKKLLEQETLVEELNAELAAAKLAELRARKSAEESEKKVKDLEAQASESTQLVSELDFEIHTLKQEVENAKSYEQKLLKLNDELAAADLAEKSARKTMEEWVKKVKDLEAQAEESNRLERSASESLESVMKQLEGSNDLLQDAESEIASLREKVGLLEFSVTRQRGDLEESERQLSEAKETAAEMTKKAELLGYELENVEEEKNQALNNEKLAAESVQTLLEEKNKIINELESLRAEEQKSKKAAESLEKALREASSQAKESKERLSSSETEQENYENQIENLRLVLNATNEKYTAMLDEAKHEIDMLTDTIEQNKEGYLNSRTEWEQREVVLMSSVKKSEDENSLLQNKISQLRKVLKEAEEEARLKVSREEAESEVAYLKAESMKLKESLVDKENETKSVVDENNELRRKETASVEKIEELTKLLDEAMIKNQEKGVVLENGKDYDLPTKVVECYEQNGNGKEEEKPIVELPPQQLEQAVEEKNHTRGNENSSDEDVKVEVDVEKLNGHEKDEDSEEKGEEITKEVDVKMWEIIKIGEKEKELLHNKEQKPECLKEDLDLKADNEDENIGNNSPSKQFQKKKKPLLQKFGSLLKRKSTTNQM